MKPKYPYALYLDSKIVGTAIQLRTFFDQGVFLRNKTVVYIKKYKESASAIQKIFERAQIPYQFMRPSELDQLSDQIIFYAFNAQSNCRLVANRKLKHVFITHGESNKISSIKPIIRIYDHVTMAGQLSLERYYKSGLFDEDDYEKGRLILVGDTFVNSSGLSQDPNNEHVLFYAPTWEGGLESENYSSLKSIAIVENSILKVLKKLNLNTILVQIHPNLGHREKIYINNLIKLIINLRKNGVTVYLNSNGCSFNLYQKLYLQFHKVNRRSDLENFYPIYALVDLSAMESICINEEVPYNIFLSNSQLRADLPLIYQELYKKQGIFIDEVKQRDLNMPSIEDLQNIKKSLFEPMFLMDVQPKAKRIDLLIERLKGEY